MGHHEDGLALAVHLVEEAQKAVGGLAVQGPGGLVGQDDAGLGDEGPGHSHPLLLPAGDLVGVLLQQCVDTQPPGQGQQPLLHLLVGLPRQHQGEQDVVLDGECVQEIEILEDKAQVVPTEGSDVPLLDGDDVLPVQQDLAAGGLIQGRQDIQQGRLAAAGLAHDGDVLSGLHGKVDAGEGLDLLSAETGGIDLFQIADLKDRHCFFLLGFVCKAIIPRIVPPFHRFTLQNGPESYIDVRFRPVRTRLPNPGVPCIMRQILRKGACL